MTNVSCKEVFYPLRNTFRSFSLAWSWKLGAHLNLMYPGGTGSSFNILIEDCTRAFFISGLIFCCGEIDLRDKESAADWSFVPSIEFLADSRSPLVIIGWWGLKPGGAANIKPKKKLNVKNYTHKKGWSKLFGEQLSVDWCVNRKSISPEKVYWIIIETF